MNGPSWSEKFCGIPIHSKTKKGFRFYENRFASILFLHNRRFSKRPATLEMLIRFAR